MENAIYRGKRLDTNKWIKGGIHLFDGYRPFIILGIQDHIKLDEFEVTIAEVIPETVGQFIGQLDKAGKQIFSGDIVRHSEGRLEKVYYHKDNCSFQTGASNHVFDQEFSLIYGEMLVVGNIIDNPDLIGE